MKKIYSVAMGVILFLFTYGMIGNWSSDILEMKKEELTYHNDDIRNFDKEVMGSILCDNSILVLGSSELSASDEVGYPPALFHYGDSDYNMILVGRGNMQSLHHAINVGALANDLANRKVVLILSPQWFTSEHLSSEAYASRFSEHMYMEFLKNPQISDETKNDVLKRVRQLLSTDQNQLKRVEKWEQIYLQKELVPFCRVEMGMYDSFMEMRGKYNLACEIKSVTYQKGDMVLVENIDFGDLLIKAEAAGKEACTNNDLYIYNEYYDRYIRDARDSLKDSSVDKSYLVSPEYGDFSLFLEICQETSVHPLVVNVPVHGLWYDWIGFPSEEREAYYQKIREICAEYQVEMVDFSDKEYEPYFLKDIMHLGWKGWVYLDEAVYEFYKKDGAA